MLCFTPTAQKLKALPFGYSECHKIGVPERTFGIETVRTGWKGFGADGVI